MNSIYDHRQEFVDSIQKFMDEADTLKPLKSKVSDALAELQSNMEYWIQTDMAYNFGLFVQRMAEDAIKAMLEGDEEGMRRALSCTQGGYTGRDREHPVIHGKLFETGALELRKKIVDAHAELLKSERILDLEDQVKSLVKQCNVLNHQLEECYSRNER